MAQQSFRYNPVQLYNAWWRVDISWRTDPADDHHFIDEWGSGIPAQPAGQATFIRIPSIKLRGRGDAELQMIDSCEFEFEAESNIISCLAASNFSAELRLWVSLDNAAWHPLFWGIIDLNDVRRKRIAKIGSTWIKGITFTVYDGIKRLEETPFGVVTRMALSSYIKTGVTVYNGATSMQDVLGLFNGAPATVIPKNLISGNPELFQVTGWMNELAKWCFDEQYFQTTATQLAFFGYGSTPVDSPFSFIAHLDNTTMPATLEKQLNALHVWHNVFSAEWADDFDSWAEFLVMLAEFLGFAISTRHTLVGTPAKWVRSLQYARLDGQNGKTITPAGVLMESDETTGRRLSRRVVVTSRFPDGGHKIDDVYSGINEILNLTTHFHTLGAYNVNAPDSLTGDQKRNSLWHTLVIHDSGSTYRLVNQVKCTSAYGTFTFPQFNGYQMWDDENVRLHNGVALAMAHWHAYSVLGPKARSVIQETVGSLNADDGSSSLPIHWQPYTLIGDAEYTGSTYKLLEAELMPETGEVKITKELTV